MASTLFALLPHNKIGEKMSFYVIGKTIQFLINLILIICAYRHVVENEG